MIKPAEKRLTGQGFCSYRTGGSLDEPYLPETPEEAIDVLSMAKKQGKPLTIIGGGANTIIASRGIRGVTFISKNLKFIDQAGDATFNAGSGTYLAKIALFAQKNSLAGAEFMIGIPGTLGGAIVMNAGAMGQETSEIVAQVVLYNLATGKIELWDKNQVGFAYRKSEIDPQCMIVLGACLNFSHGDERDIAEKMEKSIMFRKTRHPKEPNGGSVFKNPSPESTAGRLLDEIGAKEWHEGGARVSSLHANFIVNVNNASSTDILRLMLRMKRSVKKSFAIELFPENRFAGDASEEEKSIWEELTGHAWKY